MLAEDTRVTAKLLARLGISPRMESLHEHNERERVAPAIARLLAGDDVALVSDAGTPLLSDPGFLLVREAAKAGIAVVPIPGPSAVMAALAVAALPVVPFTFLGFFPRRGQVELLASLPASTVVFFETPHRIRATLELLARHAASRPVVLARELTKLHEEVVRGSAASILAAIGSRELKGEIVLVLGPAAADAAAPPGAGSPAGLAARFAELVAAGASRTEALRRLSRETGRSRRELYRELVVDGAAGEGGDAGAPPE